MMRGKLLLFVALSAVVSVAVSDDVLLKPVKSGMQQLALVYIQGAQIQPDQYIPVATTIQNASQYSLWVGIPDFAFDIPEPIVISGGINRMLQSMRDAGMNASNVFFAGHSFGGAMLQDYLFKNDTTATGQILMGSFITRNHRNVTYPVPTLTIGGELDGLCRVTRIMEEYYHRITHSPKLKDAIKNFPVTVIEGLNHMQFASGDPPALVKYRDLRPEISYTEAHEAIATLISAFMSLHLGDASALSTLTNAVEKTGTFVQPIMSAYEIEGFYNLKPPCYDNPPSPACTLGCPWTQQQAMPIMGGLKTATLNDTDAFHPVWQTNLPHILNNCSSPTPSCKLQTTTVTQAVYNDLDILDTGFVYTSANELRTKLKSRQAVMEAAGYQKVDFNTTDGSSICKVINEEAYSWALGKAGSHTLARFKQYGVPMVMGKDKGPYNVGPLWIWTPLSYDNIKNGTGQDILEIRSVMLRTPTDFYVKAAAGMHYCKLLSPARAIEWIYVDGLRAHYSINS